MNPIYVPFLRETRVFILNFINYLFFNFILIIQDLRDEEKLVRQSE